MMKKNTLYTVNRFNRPMFMPKENLFALAGPINNSNLSTNELNYLDSLDPGDLENDSYANSLVSKSKGSGAGFGAMKGAAIGAASGLAQGIGTSEQNKRGLFDLADPVHQLAGGKESGVGNALGDAGVGLFQSGASSGNPWMMLAGAGLKVVGGLTNAAFGTKWNQERINDIEESNASMRTIGNTLGNASDYNELMQSFGKANMGSDFTQDDIGEDGWFTSAAEDKFEDLHNEWEGSKKFLLHAAATGADNIDTRQDQQRLSNFTLAYGGPLFNNDNMGAIEYNFISDYLDTKKKNTDNKNQMSNLFMGTPSSMFDFGGNLQTNGADWPTKLTHIDAGKSHEENPNDGVQMGVDNEGTPNLVEEGETVYNDYVFSNRILADDATKQIFKLPKKRDVTFADISKKLEKEIAERPNDPISKAGFEAQMQALEEQQERQKSEMEAERARAAFEALSPEEQTAVMQNIAQQEAMAQQAAEEQAIAEQQAMQQPSPEEVAMMQQQADGTQAALGQPAPEMAEGGKLFKKGGYKWSSFWSPVNEYSKQKGNAKNKYKIDKTYKGDIKELENSDAYKAFTDYILNNATDEERLNYFKWIDANTGKENKYLDKAEKLLEGWQEAYKNARNDGLYGIQHYTPEFDPEIMVEKPATKEDTTPAGRIFHTVEGEDDYLEGEPNTWVGVGPEVRREILDNGDTVIYHNPQGRPEVEAVEGTKDNKNKVPIHRNENLRYVGLLGPAVGLGMQALGIGKPDYGRLDAAVESIGNAHLADYKPLGNYLTYRPMDIWFEQNRMDANARATDRAIMNSTSPSRMAGLLANGYNSLLASGDLYRKALEYNDAKRERVASFNRGTDQFNAEAYNRNSQFNADALNRNRQYRAGLAMQAARDRMAEDAEWYNGIYGNVAGLFKGIGDLGTENYRMNRISDMAADGIFGNLGDSYTGRKYVRNGAKGGQLNKKKKGLTF